MYHKANYFNLRTIYDPAVEQKPAKAINDIEPSLNSILATVHQQLKYNPKPAVPRIPKPIADTLPSRKTEVFLTEGAAMGKRRLAQKNTIPQLQADLEYKRLQEARHVAITSDMMNYQNQKRYREVLRQKRILENMLKEHKRLQSDRDNIASEISFMRSYLDNIRNKLDVSLRKLNTQKTIAATCPVKKVGRVQQRLNGPAQRPPISKSAGNVNTTNARTTNRMYGGGYDPSSTSNARNRANLQKSCSLNAPANYSKAGSTNNLKFNRSTGGFTGAFAQRNKIAPADKSLKPRLRVKSSRSRRRVNEPRWVYCTKIDRKGEYNKIL